MLSETQRQAVAGEFSEGRWLNFGPDGLVRFHRAHHDIDTLRMLVNLVKVSLYP